MHNIHIPCIMVFHYLLFIKLSIKKRVNWMSCVCLAYAGFFVVVPVFGLTEFPLIKTTKKILSYIMPAAGHIFHSTFSRYY